MIDQHERERHRVVIQKFYGLDRPVTDAETDGEIANLQRTGIAGMNDRQLRLTQILGVRVPIFGA